MGAFSGVGFPTDLPPFTPDEPLAKSAKAGVAPKLMLSNGSHEYWGRAAGLNHISADGKHDVGNSSDVRNYYVAGTQHGSGGAPTEQYPLTGSMIAFARTHAEREARGDPRLSVEERYPSEQESLNKIESAARELAKDRFLLDADVPQAAARAKQRWESLTAAH